MKYTTLTLTLTVRNDDVREAKAELLEALEGDFDAIYSTHERPATDDEAERFSDEYGGWDNQGEGD